MTHFSGRTAQKPVRKTVEKKMGFQQFPPGFQQLLRKSAKRNAKKQVFSGKSPWKTQGKTWKSLSRGENLLNLPRPPQRIATQNPEKGEYRYE
ncbi:hypothetical protein L0N24_07005 [Faecalibacterium prausnitzii]|uniref:hypothetical protein n=1 Tax=Faecalibacterium prausnitzii TaxID=853 RepID=UPI001EDF29B9|nr:hypothetical protein [Faecalibacterium prausnitzii]MCG4603271.1 hypothetical protein [Faecalibacterium prausnitzii]